jgi:hypothetical protein
VQDVILFFEYFRGDNGRRSGSEPRDRWIGLGAN